MQPELVLDRCFHSKDEIPVLSFSEQMLFLSILVVGQLNKK